MQRIRGLLGGRGPSVVPRRRPVEDPTRVHFDVLPGPLLARVAAEAAAFHQHSIATAGTGPIAAQTTQWLDLSDSPKCAIEEAIGTLHQLAWSDVGTSLAGCEWWVQSRAQPGGMSLHLDTDMQLHHRDNSIRCPELSSVFYLNASPSPTMILGQHLELGFLGAPKLVPAEVEQVDLIYPLPNQYAVFAGNKVHGVLPTETWHASSPLWHSPDVSSRTTLLVNYWADGKPEAPCCVPTDADLAMQLKQAGEASSSSIDIDHSHLADGSLGTRELQLLDLEQAGEGVLSMEAEVVVAKDAVLSTQFFVPDVHEWAAGCTTLKGMGRRRMVDNCFDM